MQCSSHQLQMCERGAVPPDVSCTSEHQTTTIAFHQSTINHQARYNVMSDYICKLWVVEVRDVVFLCLFCCITYFSVHQYQSVPIYLSV